LHPVFTFSWTVLSQDDNIMGSVIASVNSRYGKGPGV
jgi:hypothetical protein